MADIAEESGKLRLVQIQGFRSIAAANLELRDVNVLIGPNGAGKSNLIGFLRLVNAMVNEALPRFVSDYGGSEELLHFGTERTPTLSGTLWFGPEPGGSTYDFTLEPSAGGTLFVADESVMVTPKDGVGSHSSPFRPGAKSSDVPRLAITLTNPKDKEALRAIQRMLSGIRSYHFHNSTETSLMRSPQSTRDDVSLMARGQNTAVMLWRTRDDSPARYRRIVEEMRRILPEFQDFVLEPRSYGGNEKIELRWRSVNSSRTMGPNQLSDGSIRAVSLLTLLLQPDEWKPSIIVIDEPELGLHPYAVGQIGRLIAEAGTTRQVIVSTQSPGLVAQFEPEDVVVVETEKGASSFRRLDRETLGRWLRLTTETWEGCSR